MSADASETETDDIIQNQVVARSNIGTAFYLFTHQAGGHKPFLRSALGDVCKPAIPLELQFYQALDTRFPQLKLYVPPFVGVITVDLHPVPPTKETEEDHTDESSVVEGDLMRALHLETPRSAGSSPGGGKKRRLDETRCADASPSSSPPGPMRSVFSTASYSAKLWKKERSRASSVHRSNSSNMPPPPTRAPIASVSREYLVLGDLTRAYSKPCVLDVKMGTRQHGEDATPAKAASHTAKCAATTSLELGVRICGMQIYDEVTQRYILWDKHWGRQLTKQDLVPALTTYLSNGRGLHRDSLRSLREQLAALERVVSGTTGVRFWGSSLLLIYEGDRQHATRREDVHLIDFAHCQMTDALASPDEGLLLGLTNLIGFLSTIIEKHDHSNTIE